MFQKRFPPGRLLASAITVALAAPAAVANTISVNGTTCTLANAIMSANTGSAVGGCATGASGHDSIVLIADAVLTGELPAVASDIDFDGNLHTVDGDNSHRLFFIGGEGQAPHVSFANISLAGGIARGGNGRTGGGGGAGLGGAVFVYDGVVDFEGVSFTSNGALGGAGNGQPVFCCGYFSSGGGGGDVRRRRSREYRQFGDVRQRRRRRRIRRRRRRWRRGGQQWRKRWCRRQGRRAVRRPWR
jgi:hypothetical protein